MKSAKSLYVALLAGTVWYHRPGTRWYGKTRKRKYVTRALPLRWATARQERIRREFQHGRSPAVLVRDISSALFERSFFTQDDFSLAHELVVQPLAVLISICLSLESLSY